MAQSRVSDFFVERKRNADVNPSKRRKVILSNEVETTTVAPTSTRSTRSRAAKASVPDLNPPTVASPAASKAKTPACKATRAGGKSTKKSQQAVSQKSIKDLFGSGGSNESEAGVQIKSEPEICAVPTAACDDHHVSEPEASALQIKEEPKQDEAQTKSKKRGRPKATMQIDLLKEEPVEKKAFDFKPPTPPSPEVLSRKVVSPKRKSLGKETPFIFQGKEKELPASSVLFGASTPTKETVADPAELKSKLQKNVDNVKAKLKGSSKLEQLKEKLLELQREKQATASPSKAKVSEQKAVGKVEQIEKTIKSPPRSGLSDGLKSPVKTDSPAKQPAYIRHSALVETVPPTLTLPAHYKLLQDVFTSTDTIIAMLHKRREICTFSKLCSAVQEMTKKAFTLKHLGQIKTVSPLAYFFKQERNLPGFGKKQAGYQLTVEANLTGVADLGDKKVSQMNNCMQEFSTVKMLERRTNFHRQLIKIVKKFHQDFLLSLSHPLTVPDSKVTRWHPGFRLDSVPEVEGAALPEAPDSVKITTASDALRHARDRFNPTVVKALEFTVNKNTSENKDPGTNQKEGTSKKEGGTSTVTKASDLLGPAKPAEKQGNTELKGVPMSLLERIRAKEAKKQEESMQRSPAAVKHAERLARLPELIRILRTFFVTQKKLALPVDDVTQKLTDSYSTSLGPAEALCHLNLLVEVTPEWVSIVRLQRGSFVKIDRNKDINGLIEKVNKLCKQSS